MGAFRTDWDTAANPRYDVWTTTNGGEVIPGVLSPFTATMYNQFDSRGLRDLMKAYPSGNLVKIYSPPVGNFFGITAGRLTLNVGFSVAAMSSLEPHIATAMAGQFFQGSDDALRYIVHAPADKVAQAMGVATAQREAAEAESRADQEQFYAERLQGTAADDRALTLKKAWKRFQDLVPSTLEVFNRHLVVSTAAGEMSVRLAGVIAAGGGDPNAIIGLCSGLGNVESSKPALKLYDLATVARRYASVKKVLLSGDTAAVIAALAEPPDKGWEAFADEFDEFIHRYGFRVQGEADPMVADWGENPTFVISQVRSMMNLKPNESPAAHSGYAPAATAAAGGRRWARHRRPHQDSRRHDVSHAHRGRLADKGEARRRAPIQHRQPQEATQASRALHAARCVGWLGGADQASEGGRHYFTPRLGGERRCRHWSSTNHHEHGGGVRTRTRVG